MLVTGSRRFLLVPRVTKTIGQLPKDQISQ
jgi:hypothetical protein